MEKKILVVDDSRFIFEEMKYKLGDCEKYQISYYCPDGESVIDTYEKHQPDLVTIDIVMSGMDGIEATKKLMETHPEARVIVVSSLVFDDTIDDAKNAGAIGFLPKPFERDQLISCFDEAFHKRP